MRVVCECGRRFESRRGGIFAEKDACSLWKEAFVVRMLIEARFPNSSYNRLLWQRLDKWHLVIASLV